MRHCQLICATASPVSTVQFKNQAFWYVSVAGSALFKTWRFILNLKIVPSFEESRNTCLATSVTSQKASIFSNTAVRTSRLQSSAIPLWEPHGFNLQQNRCENLTASICSNTAVRTSRLQSATIPLWEPHGFNLQQYRCENLTASIFSNTAVRTSRLQSAAIPLWEPHGFAFIFCFQLTFIALCHKPWSYTCATHVCTFTRVQTLQTYLDPSVH